MEKQNAKIGEGRKLSKIRTASEKNMQDEPLGCGQFNCVHSEDTKTNEMRR
jgi:hypothetical protein